jgi:protein SCO1/2
MHISKKWKKYIALGGMLFLFPLFFLLFFGKVLTHNFKTLPYLNPQSGVMVDSSAYAIPPFEFTDQNGAPFHSDSLKGKVWLAAFYSLNNPHLPKITERLLNINFKFRSEPDIRIITFSTDCDSDTPAKLKGYTDQLTRYNLDPGKWQFLTGDQQAMQAYIKNGFLINDLSNEAIFRLIDDKGQIRGLYGNTEYHILNAIEDIALLKKEIDQTKYNERKRLEKENK